MITLEYSVDFTEQQFFGIFKAKTTLKQMFENDFPEAELDHCVVLKKNATVVIKRNQVDLMTIGDVNMQYGRMLYNDMKLEFRTTAPKQEVLGNPAIADTGSSTTSSSSGSTTSQSNSNKRVKIEEKNDN